MKKEIEITFTKTALEASCWIFENLKTGELWQTAKPPQKVALSLAEIVSKKLRKKRIDREDNSKNFKMKMKYHEAYAFLEIIKNNFHTLGDDWFAERSAVRTLINDLQKWFI